MIIVFGPEDDQAMLAMVEGSPFTPSRIALALTGESVGIQVFGDQGFPHYPRASLWLEPRLMRQLVNRLRILLDTGQ